MLHLFVKSKLESCYLPSLNWDLISHAEGEKSGHEEGEEKECDKKEKEGVERNLLQDLLNEKSVVAEANSKCLQRPSGVLSKRWRSILLQSSCKHCHLQSRAA